MATRHITDPVTTLRFAIWASRLGRTPTLADVQGYLQCPRLKAVAWRRNLLKALTTARDIPTPAATGTTKRNPHETRN